MALLDFLWSRPQRPAAPVLEARYDAAQTTDKNAQHWGEADLLSANGANNAQVRQILRKRARYERDNAPYCKGIVQTLANDTIGCGPTLQLSTGNQAADDVIEDLWRRWCDAVSLDEKLRTGDQAMTVDGEAFGVLITNDKIPGPVKLDIKLVEADQVTTPTPLLKLPQLVDGVELDPVTQEPAYYHLLKSHPGDGIFYLPISQFDRIPERFIVHAFMRDRPGQQRGIPQITSALPLFAQLRRYTGATLDSAEAQASIAGVLKTTTPPEMAAQVEPNYPLRLVRGAFLSIPEGWDIGQAATNSPNATYQMFKNEVISEAARCLSMPFCVAACNSSSYNYASGRLDFQVYHRSIRTRRSVWAQRALRKVFAAWVREADAAGIIPDSAGDPEQWSVSWAWDSGEHVDPLKEASATTMRLANRTTTYAREYAKLGLDWRTELEQVAREQALLNELEIKPVAEAAQTPPNEDPSQQKQAAAADE